MIVAQVKSIPNYSGLNLLLSLSIAFPLLEGKTDKLIYDCLSANDNDTVYFGQFQSLVDSYNAHNGMNGYDSMYQASIAMVNSVPVLTVYRHKTAIYTVTIDRRTKIVF